MKKHLQYLVRGVITLIITMALAFGLAYVIMCIHINIYVPIVILFILGAYIMGSMGSEKKY